MKKLTLILMFIFYVISIAYCQEKVNVVITGKLMNKLPVTISVKTGNSGLTPPKRYVAIIKSDSTF